MRALTLMKVFDARQGAGTYVTSLEPEILLEFISVALDLVQDQHTPEIFEVRRLLEPAATALAAQRITDADVAALEECLRRLDEAPGWHEMVDIDAAFHDRIVQATGNSTLRVLLGSVSQHTVRARVWRGIAGDNVLEWTRQQHLAILRALSERDPVAASAAAHVHVVETERWVRRYLDKARQVQEGPD